MNIEEFKRMPLSDFCIEVLGYIPVSGKDSKKWRCLRGPNGIKIITSSAPATNGDYLFFSHDTDAKGSVIQLLTQLHGYTSQQILSDFCSGKIAISDFTPKVVPQSQPDLDHATEVVSKIYQSYLDKCTLSYDNYLSKRGISQEVISFYGLKVMPREFMLPLYCLENGIFKVPTAIRYFYNSFNERCRLFLKNLSKNGGYSLLFPKSRHITNFDKLYLFESPIDALSYAQLFPYRREGIYISCCGAFGRSFKDQLVKFISKFNMSDIRLCFDNDTRGMSYINEMSSLLKNANITIHLPSKKDWNDEI